jgi:hypothetical protein
LYLRDVEIPNSEGSTKELLNELFLRIKGRLKDVVDIDKITKTKGTGMSGGKAPKTAPKDWKSVQYNYTRQPTDVELSKKTPKGE